MQAVPSLVPAAVRDLSSPTQNTMHLVIYKGFFNLGNCRILRYIHGLYPMIKYKAWKSPTCLDSVGCKQPIGEI